MDNKDVVLKRVERLIKAYQEGLLGGEKMPEHENPCLEKASKENYMYFTLPMALNYQRNSYVLWECANRLYKDEPSLFDSRSVSKIAEEKLRELLAAYKVALQPNKQPVIWKTLCNTINYRFDGDIRNFFKEMGYEVARIKDYIQKNKKDFPYLGGTKICNYWLYVMEQYTDAAFVDRENITVAPDTHVIQASTKLGIITQQEAEMPCAQEIAVNRWHDLLEATDYVPIDVHTPMWLWSRGKFSINIMEE